MRFPRITSIHASNTEQVWSVLQCLELLDGRKRKVVEGKIQDDPESIHSYIFGEVVFWRIVYNLVVDNQPFLVNEFQLNKRIVWQKCLNRVIHHARKRIDELRKDELRIEKLLEDELRKKNYE